MMGHNLSKDVKFDPVIAYTAAGQTAVNGDALDMSGFEGVQFIALLGTITTANATNLHIEMSTASAGTYVDCAGSAAFFASTQGSSSIYLVAEVYRPIKRYVRCVVDRSAVAADSVILAAWANRYRPGSLAVAESTYSNVIDYTLVISPASGSATG